MRELIAEREWLTVSLLPAHSPGPNPVEGVWAHAKRSQANLAVVALDRIEALVRNRLKRLPYRPGTLDGFIAGTGLTLDDPTSPRRAEAGTPGHCYRQRGFRRPRPPLESRPKRHAPHPTPAAPRRRMPRRDGAVNHPDN
jgi:hypothetical protein